VLGVALLVTMRHRAFARGTAWGLALQSAFMLTLDFFAEQRARVYIELLTAL
jgi:Na+-translocating ferredoxin:NAD+ oxidoreductase RnfA subunit